MPRSEQLSPASCPAGPLEGLDRGLTKVFKGIPFAEASRFEDPGDVEVWNRTLDATSFQSQAPQAGGSMERMLGGSSLPTDEKCLFLNVYTPSCDSARRPVLVWIHGGAFRTGGGAMPWYDGSRLATNRDVVVVTINYRLGAFGYLGARNSGTLDQVSALRWVARNIESFGGDPDNVTIFGESAGGSAAIALLATPTADQLFHRVWAMSPSIPQLRNAAQGSKHEDRFLEALAEIDPEQAISASVKAVLAAQASLEASGAGSRIFAPTDGTPSIPRPILDAASLDPRPLVIGTTRDEFSLFTAFEQSRSAWTDDDIEREFKIHFGADAATATDAYRSHRPEATASQLVSAMETDQFFRWPAWKLADARSAGGAGHTTWMYGFDFATPSFGGLLGSCHGLDIPFAFDNLHRPGVEPFTGSGEERQGIADQFSEAIASFAHGQDPGWPTYDHADRLTQRIGPDPQLVSNPDSVLRDLWQERSSSQAALST